MNTAASQAGQWFACLQHFHRLVGYQQRLLQLRALVYGGLILCLCYLLFTLSMAPRNAALFTLPLLLLPLLAVAAPVISLLLRHVERQCHALARTFFMAGYRVDDAGRLITNTAHPVVIAEPQQVVDCRRLAA
jgi:hypothetical protein